MSGWALDEETTARHEAMVSGVHEAPTEPAPYVEEDEGQAELIGSIPRRKLTADFEPVVALADGRTCGFEALAHCTAHGLGETQELYARATFEKTVGELGRAVREIAVRECSGSPLYISVHPNELKSSWLVRPDDPIAFHDSQIYLQVSQAVIAGLPRQIICELGTRPGVSLVIDDFGTGPATLQQIVELQPGAVKIGRELVAGLDRSPRQQAAVRAVASLCRELGICAMARGVDQPQEAQALAACGVQVAQGRVFGEPSPLPAISIWPPNK